MAPVLAYVGLGNMGRAMAANLVKNGGLTTPLILYNRTPKRAYDLSAEIGADKTTVVEKLPDVVDKADIIFTCVGDDPAINAIYDAALTTSVAGKLFVDCSTVHPETTNANGQRLTAAGAEFVACPVFGAPAAAIAAQLVCLPAGPKASVAQVLPYLTGVTGRAVIDFTDKPWGDALKLKVLGNAFVINAVSVLAETHVVAGQSGLGNDYLEQFVDLMLGGLWSGYSKRMTGGDYTRENPLFAVDLALKDIRHAQQLATSNGATLDVLEPAKKHLAKLKEIKGENGDIAGMYGAARVQAGLPF